MISEELAGFLPAGLSVSVATRDRKLVPNGARASAAIVEKDRIHITVFVPKDAAGPILRDLAKTPAAAVLFVRPTDDRACQLKGTFTGSRAARPGERAVVKEQFDAFRGSLEAIGISRELTAGWSYWPCVAIRISVSEMFDQTPGPGAGGPLK